MREMASLMGSSVLMQICRSVSMTGAESSTRKMQFRFYTIVINHSGKNTQCSQSKAAAKEVYGLLNPNNHPVISAWALTPDIRYLSSNTAGNASESAKHCHHASTIPLWSLRGSTVIEYCMWNHLSCPTHETIEQNPEAVSLQTANFSVDFNCSVRDCTAYLCCGLVFSIPVVGILHLSKMSLVMFNLNKDNTSL